MTTDVTNIQKLYYDDTSNVRQSPCYVYNGAYNVYLHKRKTSVYLLVAIPIIGIMVVIVSKFAMPKFRIMLKKMDQLNRVVQEKNLSGIRVVKAFVRGEYEDGKFETTTREVRDTQKAAEKLIVVNMPIMQLVVYCCIVAILWFGGKHDNGRRYADRSAY